MKLLSIFTIIVFTFGFLVQADINFQVNGGFNCTGADDGTITCDRADPSIEAPTNDDLLETRSLSPLSRVEIGKRGTCELGGVKACYFHCVAIGMCHATCSSSNICQCACRDNWWDPIPCLAPKC